MLHLWWQKKSWECQSEGNSLTVHLGNSNSIIYDKTVVGNIATSIDSTRNKFSSNKYRQSCKACLTYCFVARVKETDGNN